MTPRRLVLVFSRAPRDERRAKPLGGRDGARVERLHRALLERALTAAAGADADVRLVTTGPLDAMRALAGAHVPPARLTVTAQAGAGFLQRLERAVRDAFADGYGPVVVLGGDAPAVGRAHLDAAFCRLAEGAGAVLGPAADGGYYLLALAAFSAAPFTGVPLQTPTTFARTRAALAAAGLAVATLPPLDDVDSIDDAAAVAALIHCASPRVRRAARALLAVAVAPIDDVRAPHALHLSIARHVRGPPLQA